eukprot:423604_1
MNIYFHTCIWIITLIITVTSDNSKETHSLTAKEYKSYHFEWNNPSQWITNSNNDINNDIISCTAKIPSLCIYAQPNKPGFQLFYNNLMYDFMNDYQWNKINIINIIDDNNKIKSQKDILLKRLSTNKSN